MSSIDKTLELPFVNSKLVENSFETALTLRQMFSFVVARYQFSSNYVDNSVSETSSFTYMLHFAVVLLQNPYFHIYCCHQHNALCCRLADAALAGLNLLGKQRMIEQMEQTV